METHSLTKVNNSLGPTRNALMSMMIRNADDLELRTILTKTIAKAFQDSGQASNDEDASYLIGVMPDEIKKNFPNLRIEEIPIAIEKGVRKEYGQYFGLNIISFSFFIKSYMESAERIRAAKELNKALEPTKPIPSPEEVQKSIKEAIVRAYKDFTEKGFYEDYGNFIYNKMDEMGLISLSTSRKLEIYNQAQVSIRDKKNPQRAANKQQFKELTATLELINNPDNESGKNIIKTEAKKIALQVVFQDFFEMETDINELINPKQDF